MSLRHILFILIGKFVFIEGLPMSLISLLLKIFHLSSNSKFIELLLMSVYVSICNHALIIIYYNLLANFNIIQVNLLLPPSLL